MWPEGASFLGVVVKPGPRFVEVDVENRLAAGSRFAEGSFGSARTGIEGIEDRVDPVADGVGRSDTGGCKLIQCRLKLRWKDT